MRKWRKEDKEKIVKEVKKMRKEQAGKEEMKEEGVDWGGAPILRGKEIS